jgi:hypothetical protein
MLASPARRLRVIAKERQAKSLAFFHLTNT